MSKPNPDQILKAFLKEDKRISKTLQDEEGHPFIVCTNIAKWLKKNFYPNAEIMGYHTENNSDAEIGQDAGGHDFILIDNRFIIELWFSQIEEKDCPILFDLKENPELVKKYFGDVDKWEKVHLEI